MLILSPAMIVDGVRVTALGMVYSGDTQPVFFRSVEPYGSIGVAGEEARGGARGSPGWGFGNGTKGGGAGEEARGGAGGSPGKEARGGRSGWDFGNGTKGRGAGDTMGASGLAATMELPHLRHVTRTTLASLNRRSSRS
jgi:hypothetical protein